MIAKTLKGLRTMLTKTEFPDVAHFRQALQIPEPTAGLLEAEVSQQKAAADLASASARLKAAEQEVAYAKDIGRPSKVSAAEVRALGVEVERFSRLEAKAQEALSRLRADRRTAVQTEMADAVEEFAEVLKRKVAELDTLFALGASVGDSYHRSGHLKTPQIFTVSPLMRNFMRPLREAMARVR
ncbi:hypothetical protein [Mesorhizobium caraganae]|uniref:hypothetical protein n=1 Tax=Mesorhizobium caraganae TaxID=483206 RepID=UPI00333CA1B4